MGVMPRTRDGPDASLASGSLQRDRLVPRLRRRRARHAIGDGDEQHRRDPVLDYQLWPLDPREARSRPIGEQDPQRVGMRRFRDGPVLPITGCGMDPGTWLTTYAAADVLHDHLESAPLPPHVWIL